LLSSLIHLHAFRVAGLDSITARFPAVGSVPCPAAAARCHEASRGPAEKSADGRRASRLNSDQSLSLNLWPSTAHAASRAHRPITPFWNKRTNGGRNCA